MAQPTPYERLYNLVQYATDFPANPYNPAQHDAEFDAVEENLDGLNANLALLQRDDGALANLSVHPNALSSATRLLIASWNIRGNWTAFIDYAVKDFVVRNSLGYVAMVAHTSNDFTIDLAAGRWLQVDVNMAAFAASSGSSLVGFIQSGTGAITRTEQDKLRDTVNALDFGSMTVTPGADINLAIASLGSVGGVVDIPDGSFSVETTILQPSNVTLRGRGIGATKLTAATGLNAPVIKNATAISSQSITGITRTGRTATATKNSHGYSNGTYVFVSGAAQLGYNGVFQIFNVSANTFDFYVEKTTVTPATGTLLVYQAVDSNLAIYDLEIVGNASNTAGNNYGLQYHGVNRFILHNVYAHDTYHTCLVFTSAVNGFLGNVMGDGAINSSHDGLLFGTSNSGPGSGFSYCADIVIQGGSYSGNGQTGVETVAGRGFAFNGTIARRNAVGGFTTSNASQVTFNGCLGEKNVAHGIELYLNTGASDVSVIGGIWRENGESGIFCTQNDTGNTASHVLITGNICSNNAQIAAGVAYGIAIELAASTTIDGLVVTNNIATNNARGLSFGTNGTVINSFIDGNICNGNTLDINIGASLQRASATFGFNPGLNSTSYNGSYPTSVQRLQLWTDNLPQSSGTVVLSDGFGARGYQIPRAGYIRSMACKSNANITAGNATFQLRVNGSINSNFNTQLNTTNPTFLITQGNVQAAANVLAAGDMITVIVTGDGSLLPNGTADFDVVVEVAY